MRPILEIVGRRVKHKTFVLDFPFLSFFFPAFFLLVLNWVFQFYVFLILKNRYGCVTGGLENLQFCPLAFQNFFCHDPSFFAVLCL